MKTGFTQDVYNLGLTIKHRSSQHLVILWITPQLMKREQVGAPVSAI